MILPNDLYILYRDAQYISRKQKSFIFSQKTLDFKEFAQCDDNTDLS